MPGSFEGVLAQSVSFFDTPEPIRLDSLAVLCGCELRSGDDGALELSSVGPIEAAPEGSLTFVNNSRYLKALADTRAAAVICSRAHAEQVGRNLAVLISNEPYKSFAKAMGTMFPSGLRPKSVTGEPGISDAAHIHETAQLEPDVTVEAGAVVGANVRIGQGTLIGACAVIGAGVQIGRDTSICSSASVVHSVIGNNVILHSGVRVGNDGFGFAMGPGGHLKIPQIGRVIIQDNVEVGANTTIDRGANRDTIIGEGTKIDNLVMIGHNVVMGRHCIIVAQSGIAGSAELGDFVVMGACAGVLGHVKVGDGAQIAGMAHVKDDVEPGARMGGTPARPFKEWARELAAIRALGRAKTK